jgi:flagellar basal-body rod protein FlgF
MIKGMQDTGSAMKPMMARLEVIANNLANINTTGFKRDDVFPAVLQDAVAGGGGTVLTRMESRAATDFSEGSVVQTNNPLDVALQGAGFFVVETPSGPRYTRNGSFSLAVDGTLTTSKGYPVAGTGGPIRFPDLQQLSRGSVAISESGEVSLDGKVIGQLRIVQVDRLSGLTKDGTSLFTAQQDVRTVDAPQEAVAVKQGFLEESNVDGIEEMITMIELMRAFESNQKAAQQQDATLDRTMDVGRF